MEKVLKDLNQGSNIKANKILEINPDHELFKSLKKVYDNKEAIDDYAKVLYDQALLIAGLEIKDPLNYTKLVTDLMIKAMN